MFRLSYLVPVIILLGIGCSDNSSEKVLESANVKQMVVKFQWPEGYGKCFDPKNPEIKVSDIPDNTAYFKVKVIDIQNNDYDHGGGTVENDGKGIIPYGSLKNYQGPCPSQAPTGTGTYKITVLAYSKNDSLVGQGSSSKEFP